ncbi:MAG TPA: hypothetical protein VIF81_06810, partial [Pyrinomonadaceae bacterium]
MKHFSRVFRQSISIVCLIALLELALAPASAQQTSVAKRPITHADYDSWRSIVSPQISRDGKFIAYAYMAQDDDSEIVVRNVASGNEWRAPRGYRPPAPPPDVSLPNVGEIIAEQARLVRPAFTADSRFVVFSIEPAKAEVSKARKEKKKPEDMPKNALGIMDLSSGQVAKIDRVKNFQVPEDGAGFIAYLREANTDQKKGDEKKAEGEPPTNTAAPIATPGPSPTFKEGSTTPPVASAATPGSRPTGREGSNAGRMPALPGAKKKDYGMDLVLRNTATGAEHTFKDVLDYTLSKDAKTLAYTVSSRNEETNGVYVVSTQSDAAPGALLAGKGKYQKLTWDEEQTELAFISDRDDQEAK